MQAFQTGPIDRDPNRAKYKDPVTTDTLSSYYGTTLFTLQVTTDLYNDKSHPRVSLAQKPTTATLCREASNLVGLLTSVGKYLRDTLLLYIS